MATQQTVAIPNATARPRNLKSKTSRQKNAARMEYPGGIFAVGWWSWGEANPQIFHLQNNMLQQILPENGTPERHTHPAKP